MTDIILECQKDTVENHLKILALVKNQNQVSRKRENKKKRGLKNLKI